MKILFLDIDGVANCKDTIDRIGGLIGIDPHKAFMIGKIQLDTGCEVVLSSSWRHWPEGVTEIESRIVKLLDKTEAYSDTNFRGEEVRRWLKEHPKVEHYAILDDESDFYNYQPLFQTSWDLGLTEAIAKKVTEYLNVE